MIKDRHGWLHSGHWERGKERVDYVTRMDTHMIYLRYTGDNRLVKGWQSVSLNRRFTMVEGEIWSADCPFCCSNTRSLLIYQNSLRCKHCMRLMARWTRQNKICYRYRAAIRKGNLTYVQAGLQGTPREKYLAMIAMEICGLSPRKLTSPREMSPWVQVKYRSLSKWNIYYMAVKSGSWVVGVTPTAKKCLKSSGCHRSEKCPQ